MTQLIQALLAFARTSRTEMHFGEVDLNILVDQVIGELHSDTRGRINLNGVANPCPSAWRPDPAAPGVGQFALKRREIHATAGIRR